MAFEWQACCSILEKCEWHLERLENLIISNENTLQIMEKLLKCVKIKSQG